MALPHWTVNYLRQQVGGVVDRFTQPEAIRQLRDRATGVLDELPETAARGLDRVLRQARCGTEQVHRWAQRQRIVSRPVINATGSLLGESIDAAPIAIDAIEAGVASLASFRTTDAAALARLDRRLHRALAPGSDLRIAVASRLEAALCAVAAVAVAQNRCILLPRMHAVALPSGQSLPDLLAACGATVREIGSAQRVTAADWSRACDQLAGHAAAPPILVVVGPPNQAAVPDADPQSGQPPRWCISILPEGTIRRLPETLSPQPPRVEQCIEAGADVVIVPGGGVIGGPECGLLIGHPRHVDALRQTAVWTALAAGTETLAMLAASLQPSAESAAAEANAVGQPAPVQALLETSVDNLRHRAQQLSTRIGSSEAITSCQITAEPARLRPDTPYRIPSRQLRLKKQGIDATQWAARLAAGQPAVIAHVDAETLVVDLRWVPPAADADLAMALAGMPATPEAAATQPAAAPRTAATIEEASGHAADAVPPASPEGL